MLFSAQVRQCSELWQLQMPQSLQNAHFSIKKILLLKIRKLITLPNTGIKQIISCVLLSNDGGGNNLSLGFSAMTYCFYYSNLFFVQKAHVQ